jgi:hypothetical protein
MKTTTGLKPWTTSGARRRTRAPRLAISDDLFGRFAEKYAAFATSLLLGENLEGVLLSAVNDPESDDCRDMVIEGSYTFDGSPDSYYDRPIAVLTGPKSLSAGDIFPYLLKHHPRVRRFGRPTNGAFGTRTQLWSESDPYVGDLDVTFTDSIFAAADGTLLH